MIDSAIRKLFNISHSFWGEDVQCLIIPSSFPLKPHYYFIFHQSIQVPLNSILAHFRIQSDNHSIDIGKGLRYWYFSIVATAEQKNCDVTIVIIPISHHCSRPLCISILLICEQTQGKASNTQTSILLRTNVFKHCVWICMRMGTVIIQKEVTPMKCLCGYFWYTTSNKKYTTCPSCHSQISKKLHEVTKL
jgi:hypothetical protein